MYRFLLRPRWLLFHVLVAGLVVLMVNLGFWQLRRLDEKQAFNTQVERSLDEPVAPLGDALSSGADPAALEWRRVTASGTYDAGGTITIVNRSQDGAAGELVVTPLVLEDGRVLLVERGFLPLSTIADPPPSGAVDVVGRLRQTQVRHRGGLSDPAEGALTEAQRVDIPRLAGQLPGPPVPMWIELVESSPAEANGALFPVHVPELSEGPHLSYAVQWFIFSACAVIGWVLAVRHSAATRRAQRTAAAASVPAGDETAAPSSR